MNLRKVYLNPLEISGIDPKNIVDLIMSQQLEYDIYGKITIYLHRCPIVHVNNNNNIIFVLYRL